MSQALKRADFLGACRAAGTHNKALEEIRDKGADVILATFRMMKNSLVHSVDNNAVTKTVGESHGILADFAAIVGGNVSITFVENTIFVCGQLLRASRSIYESAQEVGHMLGVVGVSEITFAGNVSVKDLIDFCRVFSVSSRDPQQRGLLLSTKLNHVVVRRVSTELAATNDNKQLPEMERALQTYAVALVVMRQFFESIATGQTVLPHRVKRVAQKLVALAQGSQVSVMAMTSMANAHRDDAGRAVQTAFLAVLLGRQLTDSRTALSQLAMTALMADVGRVRVAGQEGLDRYVKLGDQAEAAVPALAASVFIATGGVHVQNALRTVVAYEVCHLQRTSLLGALYSGTMSPLFQSRLLHVARELLDRLAPRDGSKPASPLDALAAMAGLKNMDETAYKLLVQSIGLLPTGSVVEFETGEWGIVLGPSAHRNAVAKPRIKLVTDRNGQVFSKPKVIDLGDPSQGRQFPAIVAVIEPSKAPFNVTSMLMDVDEQEAASA